MTEPNEFRPLLLRYIVPQGSDHLCGVQLAICERSTRRRGKRLAAKSTPTCAPYGAFYIESVRLSYAGKDVVNRDHLYYVFYSNQERVCHQVDMLAHTLPKNAPPHTCRGYPASASTSSKRLLRSSWRVISLASKTISFGVELIERYVDSRLAKTHRNEPQSL